MRIYPVVQKSRWRRIRHGATRGQIAARRLRVALADRSGFRYTGVTQAGNPASEEPQVPMPKHPMHDDVESVLFTPEQIQQRVKALAEEIARDYAGRDPHLITIVKGSIPFLADLIRAMDCPLSLDVIGVASYDGHQSSGEVRLTKDLDDPIEGRHVLIVEDIIDTGLTLSYVMRILRQRAPASVKVVTFLDKPSKRRAVIAADYVGFTIPDAFVVGYGLDWNQRYRNLPYVGVLKREICA
jgi:hypoxanthine phosphoribosyltransferase